VTPVLVTKPLFRWSPSGASENVVVYCAGLHSTLLVSLYVKHQTRLPPPGHMSHAVFHTLQCTGQRVQRSIKVTQTMQHAAYRPTEYSPPVISRQLRIVRYRDMKCHDVSISLLGYDMITTCISHIISMFSNTQQV